MAWERRRHGRLYLYRSWRDPVTGKVRKEYLGAGARAAAAAEQDAARRAERITLRQSEEVRRQANLVLTDQLAAIGVEADALVAAALVEAGYWRPPGRKPWRRRRSRKVEHGKPSSNNNG